jgi:hypothetical protein
MFTRLQFLSILALSAQEAEKKKSIPKLIKPPERPGRRGATVSSIELPIDVLWNPATKQPTYRLQGPFPKLGTFAANGTVAIRFKSLDPAVPKDYRFQLELLDTVKYKSLAAPFEQEENQLIARLSAEDLQGREQFELRIAAEPANGSISRSWNGGYEFKNPQRSEPFTWNTK